LRHIENELYFLSTFFYAFYTVANPSGFTLLRIRVWDGLCMKHTWDNAYEIFTGQSVLNIYGS